MKSVVFCLAVVLGVAFANPKMKGYPCPDSCPDVYQPVCGSDGYETATFESECKMRLYGCAHFQKFKVLIHESCDDDGEIKDVIVPAKPDCGICPLLYAPVCASNGERIVTFDNQCSLDVHNCENPMSAKFTSLRAGPCEEEAEIKAVDSAPNCGPCTLIYSPVCASNGEKLVTFGNKCSLDVYNCEHPKTAKFHALRAGECEEEEQTKALDSVPNCGPCTRIYAPVCASNGEEMRTFASKCVLDAHNCENPKSAKFHSLRAGECEAEPETKALNIRVPNCGVCPFIYNPVCASNGEKVMTFASKCTLDVHNCENPMNAKFHSLRAGPCEDEDAALDVAPAKPNCGICTLIYAPVCASNGQEMRTFASKCVLDVHNCENPKSAKFHSLRAGECEAEPETKALNIRTLPNCGVCPFIYNPVCASNGEKVMTFASKCTLDVHNCENPMNAKFHSLRAGPCEDEAEALDVAPAKPNCGFCTFIYAPVCATNGKETVTFGNKCTLRVHNCENPKSAKFIMTRSGEC